MAILLLSHILYELYNCFSFLFLRKVRITHLTSVWTEVKYIFAFISYLRYLENYILSLMMHQPDSFSWKWSSSSWLRAVLVSVCTEVWFPRNSPKCITFELPRKSTEDLFSLVKDSIDICCHSCLEMTYLSFVVPRWLCPLCGHEVLICFKVNKSPGIFMTKALSWKICCNVWVALEQIWVLWGFCFFFEDSFSYIRCECSVTCYCCCDASSLVAKLSMAH